MKNQKPQIEVNDDDSAQDIIVLIRRGLLNARKIKDAKDFDAQAMIVEGITKKAVLQLARDYVMVTVNVVEVEDSP